MFDVWMALNASHTSVESGELLDDDRKRALLANAPFIGDNRLLKALPFIPYLELKVIPSL
jgi:hypothetical protein